MCQQKWKFMEHGKQRKEEWEMKSEQKREEESRGGEGKKRGRRYTGVYIENAEDQEKRNNGEGKETPTVVEEREDESCNNALAEGEGNKLKNGFSLTAGPHYVQLHLFPF